MTESKDVAKATVAAKDLSSALLEFDAAAAGLAPTSGDEAARLQVQIVLRRDRRRMRVLTGVTVALWLAAAASVAGLVFVSYVWVFPRLEAAAFHPKIGGGQSLNTYVLLVGATLLAVCVGVLSLATMSTLLLVLASRRATLRHVNAGLRQVAEELRKLREAGAAPGREQAAGAG